LALFIHENLHGVFVVSHKRRSSGLTGVKRKSWKRMASVGEIWAIDCIRMPGKPVEPFLRCVCTTLRAGG
jgi:hypothetical protein